MNRDVKFKIDEAGFYLRKMKESFSQDPDRRYYLSAFLSAAKSVDYYLISRFGHLPEFQKWRSNKLDKLSIDTNLEELVKLRDQNVHHAPTVTETESTSRLANTVQLTKESEELPFMPLIPENDLVKIKLVGKQNPKIEKWRFHGDFEFEVIPFCENGLNDIKAAAVEAEKLFSK